MATLQNRLKALEGKNSINKNKFKCISDEVRYARLSGGMQGWDLKAIKGKTYDEKFSRVCNACSKSSDPLTLKESDAVSGLIEWLIEYITNINDPDVLYDLGGGKFARRSEGYT